MEFDNENLEKNSNKNIRKIILFIILGLLMIIFIYLFFIKNNDSTSSIENNLIIAAKKYVKDNNIVSSREIYINNSILNVNIDNCDKYSGVFVNGDIFTPYLKCDNYRSKIFDNNTYQLNGDEVVILPVGIGYNDPGVQGHSYQRIGEIGNIGGVYRLAYKVDNSIIYRKVVLINDNELLYNYPIINLNGDKKVIVYCGSNYEELGYNVRDNVDNDLSNKVIVKNNVNTDQIGDYVISYSITNSRGYTNVVYREVSVVEVGDTVISYNVSTKEKTNHDITLNIEVFSENFKSMDIYDGIMVIDSTKDKNIILTITENKTIKVKVYLDDDSDVEKDIIIDNIDKSVPKGSCTVDAYYNYSLFKINDSSLNNSYKYSIDNDNSNIIGDKNYRFNKRGSKYRVTIINSVGTENIIECTVNDKIFKKLYTMSNGEKCLDGFVCFNQKDYSSSQYCYYSTDTCGTIAKRGCSLVTGTIILSYYDRKSDGTAYNPYEVFEMVKGCTSCGFTAIERMLEKHGAKTSGGKSYPTKTSKQQAIEYLKRGYQLMVRFGGVEGGFTNPGSGHFMSILGINENDQVYLRETSFGNNSYNSNVNTFVDYDYIADHCGDMSNWIVVGPSDANFDL